MSDAPLPGPLAELVAARLAELEATPAAARLREPSDRTRIARLLLASDYAFEYLRRHPEDLPFVLDGDAPAPPPAGAASTGPPFEDALRRYRHARCLAIAERDLSGADPLETTLAATTALAEDCLERALVHAEAGLVQRHGVLRDRSGGPLRLVVFGLGKLGGAELNFSSDVDLVFGFASAGGSDGARALDADAWCARAGQRLIQLLSEQTQEGFVYRVDMRLRPFGSAGRLALSFDAMEQYFQREGRDWERYAWIKARPVAGDRGAGLDFLETLRPFIYRRYLDYTAFEGLREMKALISAEVQRLDLAEHVKLGPGGIREVEFIAQLLQLIRGGREPELRTRGLLPTLAALAGRGYLATAAAARLAAAYRFLRRLENRLQLLREEQTHSVPADPMLRSRLALGLGFPGWEALEGELARHRAAVSAEFEQVFEAPRPAPAASRDFAEYWSGIERDDAASRLAEAGLDPAVLHPGLLAFSRTPALATLSARARRRLDQVLPALLSAAAASAAPQPALERALRLLHAVLRRSSYLALLAEQPAALARVVDVMAASALLAERIIEHPLLLDDLLDRRSEEAPGDPDALQAELDRVMATVPGDDLEALLHALNEFRQSQVFRLGLAMLFDRLPAPQVAQQLAAVAGCIVARLLPCARAELVRSHGDVAGADEHGSLALVGYGSLGGAELGFGSDLDLVFLFDGALLQASSSGPRVLEAPRWHARLVQRLVNLLGTLTPAGRLYDVDLRLRPDGAKGLLVSSLESYAEYQHQRAWTWEHQALVRARAVGGSPQLRERFEGIRRAVLAQPRDGERLRNDVSAMRLRMRAERDRSDGARFDLKHGEGGLVDLEFLLQALVLAHAAVHPSLCDATETPALVAGLAAAGVLDGNTAAALGQAHAELLARALHCMLDQRPRLVAADAALEQACAAVGAAVRAHGLHFHGRG